MRAYRIVSKSRWNWIILYRVETNSCGMHIMRYNQYRELGAETWLHIVTIHIEWFVQTNDMTAYCLDTKLDHTVSCRNELVRDAYQTEQIRIECLVRKHNYISLQYICFVQTNDMIAYRLVSKSRWNWIILCRIENSCGMHIMRDNHVPRVFGAETWINIVTIHIEWFVQTNDMSAYRLEMKLYHTVSCRNDLVRDAYHAGQSSRIINTYCYNLH